MKIVSLSEYEIIKGQLQEEMNLFLQNFAAKRNLSFETLKYSSRLCNDNFNDILCMVLYMHMQVAVD